MSQAVQTRLREFTCRLLERRGALVDWPDAAEEGLAMLPTETAGALKCLEVLPLSHRPDCPLPVNLGGDFLERVEPLLAQEPQVVLARVPSLYLKQSSMVEPVARAFTWLNASVRVRQAEPARTEYHAWYFRAALDSAERWEEVVRTTINAASAAPVSLPDPLQWEGAELEPAGATGAGEADLTPETSDAGLPAATGDAPATYRQAARAAIATVEQRSRPSVARLESQWTRDRKRLRDYYHALLREDRRHSPRGQEPQDQEALKAKRQAVELELRRKLAELDERYALRLELSPLALVRLDCPVLAVR
jgi:hypothetical protein